jgi:hypothetical protein
LDTAFLRTAKTTGNSPPRKKQKTGKNTVNLATRQANSSASKPRPPTLDANGIHINARECDIINVEWFMVKDKSNPQWCHDDELKFLLGQPTTDYEEALKDKTKNAHEVTFPTTLAFLMLFSRRKPKDLVLSLDPAEAAAQMKEWKDGSDEKELLRFWCGVSLSCFLRTSRLTSSSESYDGSVAQRLSEVPSPDKPQQQLVALP